MSHPSVLFVVLTTFALATPVLAQSPQDEVVVTGGSVVAAESADSVRLREAVAYANPLPRGAPEGGDYPLVAWCDALVSGHIALGQTLSDPDALDRDIIQLGAEEARTFQDALRIARPRQSAATLDLARSAAEEGAARWIPLMSAEEAVRDQAFGLFFGLPGRCEHAARRLRENITTPPATPADVGLE
ncbi:hypothetical protein GVN24_29670 [Rhizobium sp. CRIBSB]|nr:hypothetical protein [Rhizobium sp. CRIBSB]